MKDFNFLSGSGRGRLGDEVITIIKGKTIVKKITTNFHKKTEKEVQKLNSLEFLMKFSGGIHKSIPAFRLHAKEKRISWNELVNLFRVIIEDGRIVLKNLYLYIPFPKIFYVDVETDAEETGFIHIIPEFNEFLDNSLDYSLYVFGMQENGHTELLNNETILEPILIEKEIFYGQSFANLCVIIMYESNKLKKLSYINVFKP